MTEPSEVTRPSGLIHEADVIICLGAGGVGKTTTAASLAIAGANAGRRTVVLTVDPARRLADALGISEPNEASDRRGIGGANWGNEPRRIGGPWERSSDAGSGGELWAAMLDPSATFDALITEHAASPEQAQRVLTNRLYRNLTSTLSGTNEYMAAERLRALHLDDRFDLVVVDTPPSQHAIDLLDSPGRLSRFVDHRLYRSILAPKRGIMRAVNAATQLAVRMISRLVGTALLEDVVDFFAAFEGMDEGFRTRAAEVDELLGSERARYVLISAARETAIAESTWTAARLAERNRTVDALIVNRLTPDFGAANLDLGDDPLDANLRQFGDLRASERELIATLASRIADLGTGAGDEPQVVEIEERAEPVADLAGLTAIADALKALQT